jgi:hypothetical protein
LIFLPSWKQIEVIFLLQLLGIYAAVWGRSGGMILGVNAAVFDIGSIIEGDFTVNS